MSNRKTFIKVFVILGSLLLVAGLAVFIIGMTATDWDFTKLNTVRYTQKSYEAEGEITSLRVEYSDAAIMVTYSETAERVTVDYPVRLNERDEEAAQIKIAEKGGTLTIIEHVEWKKNIFQWNLGNSPKVHVVLPAGKYGLDLQTSNGAILVDAGGETAFSELSLRSSNGNIGLKTSGAAVGGDAEFKTENGSISVANIAAENKLTLHTSNGSVSAENVSAKNITATTEHGDVTLTDAAADTALTAQTSTGRISLCGEIAANSLTAKTETGAILLRDGTIDANAIDLSTETGSITAENSVFAGAQSDYTVQVSTEIGNSNVSDSLGGNRRLSLKTTTGEIRVFFQN